VSLVNIYGAGLFVMIGRQRNATNAKIWGKKKDSNYDGNCTSRHCLSGTYEITGRLIFLEQIHESEETYLNWGFTITSDTPHSVGHPWTNDRSVYLTKHNTQKGQTSIPRRYSNALSQQASGWSTMPQIARPLNTEAFNRCSVTNLQIEHHFGLHYFQETSLKVMHISMENSFFSH
jgi:hypothetical protein